MGGLVTLRYLAKHSDVEGAVISAPLLGFAVRAPALKMLFARVATRLAPRLRFPNEIDPAVLSRDPDIGKAYAADPLVCKRVSLRWFSEASKAIEDFSGMAPGVRTPVLIMHGAEDRLASFEATKEIFEKIGSSDKEFQAYPGFYHELFNEPEKEQVLARACGWLEAHA
jgi:alpha-beta hydrolase superfamily lysophospholipase